MSLSTYRDAFHQEIKSFLKNLCKTFEDDRELMMITTSLHVALVDDPEDKVIAQFHEAVMPYADMVDTRDPAFFYQTHKNGTEYKLLTKLNVYWEQLSESDKKVVWDYINVLFQLSRKMLV